MIEGKGLGNKKINRVNVSLNNSFIQKLNRLAVACNTKPTTLAGLLIENCLDDPLTVAKLQKEYCIYPAYKVLPITDDKTGEVKYLLNGHGRGVR